MMESLICKFRVCYSYHLLFLGIINVTKPGLKTLIFRGHQLFLDGWNFLIIELFNSDWLSTRFCFGYLGFLAFCSKLAQTLIFRGYQLFLGWKELVSKIKFDRSGKAGEVKSFVHRFDLEFNLKANLFLNFSFKFLQHVFINTTGLRD